MNTINAFYYDTWFHHVIQIVGLLEID